MTPPSPIDILVPVPLAEEEGTGTVVDVPIKTKPPLAIDITVPLLVSAAWPILSVVIVVALPSASCATTTTAAAFEPIGVKVYPAAVMLMGVGVVSVGDVSERGMMVDGPTTTDAEGCGKLGSPVIDGVCAAVSRVGFPFTGMWLLGKAVEV